MNETDTNENQNILFDWVIRVIKGIFVGIGFITPGFSGGIMAVVYGIYEPLMRFLGNARAQGYYNDDLIKGSFPPAFKIVTSFSLKLCDKEILILFVMFLALIFEKSLRRISRTSS